MSNIKIERKKELLEANRTRLHQRELQAATLGIMSDPSINIEITEIRRKIIEIEHEIAVLEEQELLNNQLGSILRSEEVTTDRIADNPNMNSVGNEARREIKSVLSQALHVEKEIEQYTLSEYTSLEWYRMLADALALTEQWALAAEYYDKIAQFDKDSWQTHYVRGVCHQNSRNGTLSNLSALRAYGDTIALLPDNIEANFRARVHCYRGAAFKRLRRLEEAEAEFILAKKWAQEDHEMLDISYNLACIYALKGQKRKMMTQLQIVLADAEWKEVIKAKREYFSRYWHDPEFQRLLISNVA